MLAGTAVSMFIQLRHCYYFPHNIRPQDHRHGRRARRPSRSGRPRYLRRSLARGFLRRVHALAEVPAKVDTRSIVPETR